MKYYVYETRSNNTLTRFVIDDKKNLSKLPNQSSWELKPEIDDKGEHPHWFNLSEVRAKIAEQGFWIENYAEAALQPPKRKSIIDLLNEEDDVNQSNTMNQGGRSNG